WPAVAALENEWNALLRQSSADSVFLRAEWSSCWAQIVGSALRPFVVSVRDGRGRLVGLVPFYQATLCLGHTIRYRVLRVIGDSPTGAEYPDWLLLRDHEDEVLGAIVSALTSRREWDCIWMPGMAGWTGSVERIASACRAGGL